MKNKLIESNKLNKEDPFNIDILKDMLKKRMNEVDFTQVKTDASRFIFTNEDISFYSKDLFIQMIDKIS